MKSSMRSRLEQLVNRLEEIDALLSEPDTGQDMKRFRALSRERAEVEPVANAFTQFVQAEDGYQQAKELMGDPDMKEMAIEEMQQCKERIQALEDELQILLLPKDPDDSRSVFLEIRAGTGGDESALFCGDLLRMYTRYAEQKGWKVEAMRNAKHFLPSNAFPP
jgi:peptide chain release factor 1